MKQACPSKEQLWALVHGDASEDQIAFCELHLSECDACIRFAESISAEQELWGDIGESLRDQATADVCESADKKQATSFELGQIQALLGPTDDPSMLGRIGSYEVVGLLGRGGMGAVFKAFDRSLNRYVAIKLLLPHIVASGAARARFAREAQAAAAVVDDHVMPILSVDTWQGMPYLVMPYYRGCTLQQRISEHGPLGLREILRISMQAARALAAAHGQGIIHRDVKPANIFLDAGVERARLMDFGLARAVDDATLTRSGAITGTPQFMSPEQVRGESLDPRSDLFSLGAVIYAMCSGHAPFRAETSYAVLRRITDHEPRPIREMNPDIPEWISNLISKLMAKSPADRIQSAREAAELLEECLAHVQRPLDNALPELLLTNRSYVSDRAISFTTGMALSVVAVVATIAAAVALRLSLLESCLLSVLLLAIAFAGRKKVDNSQRAARSTRLSLGRKHPMKLLVLMVIAGAIASTSSFLLHQQGDDGGPEPQQRTLPTESTEGQSDEAALRVLTQTQQIPGGPTEEGAILNAAKKKDAPLTEVLKDQTLTPAERAKQLGESHTQLNPKHQYATDLTGQPAPPLNIERWTDGTKNRSLADFAGKVVYIEFSRIGYEPGRTATPAVMKKIAEKYVGEVVFLSITSPATTEEQVKLQLQRDGWPMLWGIDAPDGDDSVLGKTARAFQITAFPEFVVLDRAGRVASSSLAEYRRMTAAGAQEESDAIAEILNQEQSDGKERFGWWLNVKLEEYRIEKAIRIAQAATNSSLTAHEQIRILRLISGYRTMDSVDTRFPIRVGGKDGFTDERMIRHGETRLFDFPDPVAAARWQCGNYRIEAIDDIEPFDYVLIEWLQDKLVLTTYRKPNPSDNNEASDTSPFETAAATVDARLQEARQRLKLISRTVDRTHSLVKQGKADESRLVDLIAKLDLVRKEVAALEYMKSNPELRWSPDLGKQIFIDPHQH